MKRPIFVRPLSDAERETLEAGLRSPDVVISPCSFLPLLCAVGGSLGPSYGTVGRASRRYIVRGTY